MLRALLAHRISLASLAPAALVSVPALASRAAAVNFGRQLYSATMYLCYHSIIIYNPLVMLNCSTDRFLLSCISQVYVVLKGGPTPRRTRHHL